MQRIGYLFENVVCYDNLFLAFHKAKKGTKTKEAYQYNFQLENNLIILQKKLLDFSYRPQKYRFFILKGLKNREISVASFEDRIVHHAIVNILEPIYEKAFIKDSYATRKNKGVLKSIEETQKMIRNNEFYLKCDIEKYFENIKHDILMKRLERKIKDRKLLTLIEVVIKNIDREKGLPIGNLTSQFFANVYLDSFDHFIKEKLKIKNYTRYMDDFVIVEETMEKIKFYKKEIKNYLQEELNLKLKEKATFQNKVDNGIPFCGVRIFKNNIRLKRESLKISEHKIKISKKEFEIGKRSEEKLYTTLNSIFSYWKNYNTYELRKKIIEKHSL